LARNKDLIVGFDGLSLGIIRAIIGLRNPKFSGTYVWPGGYIKVSHDISRCKSIRRTWACIFSKDFGVAGHCAWSRMSYLSTWNCRLNKGSRRCDGLSDQDFCRYSLQHGFRRLGDVRSEFLIAELHTPFMSFPEVYPCLSPHGRSDFTSPAASLQPHRSCLHQQS
jgi:hypothetical protein